MLKLLAGRVMEPGLVESISPDTVRSYFKKTISSLGKSGNAAPPK